MDMNVLGRVISIVAMVAVTGGWLVGMINYVRIFREARRAGRDFWDLYWFGVYRYAFDEKKGSRETRWMVIGFGTMLGSVVLFMIVSFILDTARH